MECVGGERLGNQNAASGCASSGERWAGVISVVVVGRRNQQSRGRSAEAAPMAAWCDWLEENNSHWSGRGRAAGGWRQLVTSTASCSDLECTTASPCKVHEDLLVLNLCAQILLWFQQDLICAPFFYVSQE
jgi:hypothetical protein